MPTTIVNPAPNNNSTTDSGMGFLLGIILLIAFGLVFYVYGLPLVKQGLSGIGGGGVNINLPKTVDVNVQQSK